MAGRSVTRACLSCSAIPLAFDDVKVWYGLPDISQSRTMGRDPGAARGYRWLTADHERLLLADFCQLGPPSVLVKPDANDWSSRMQMCGQVECNYPRASFICPDSVVHASVRQLFLATTPNEIRFLPEKYPQQIGIRTLCPSAPYTQR